MLRGKEVQEIWGEDERRGYNLLWLIDREGAILVSTYLEFELYIQAS